MNALHAHNVDAQVLRALDFSQMLRMRAMMMHKCFVRSIVCKDVHARDADAQVLRALYRLQILRTSVT